MAFLGLLAVAASALFTGRDAQAGEPVILAESELLARPRSACEANTYLVVWQSGWPGLEGTADIEGLRLEAGTLKRLDAAPLKICAAAETQSRPAVAGGAGVFLVVWQDLRNHRHHAVRGALLDAKTGRIQVADFAIAERAHNQARPEASWTGQNFLVVWQEIRTRGTYGIMGTRVAPDGRVLDDPPHLFAEAGHSPAVCASADKALVAWADRETTSGCLVDPASGKVQKGVGAQGQLNTRCPNDIALAHDGRGNFMAVSARESFPNPWGWPGPGAVLCARVNADGSAPEEAAKYGYYLSDVCGRRVPNVVDTATWGSSDRWQAGAPGGFKGTADGMWPYGKPSVAWDGKGAFIFAWVKGRIMPDRLNLSRYEVWMRGMDAKTLAVTLPDRKVAGDAATEANQPALSAGPSGEILLVYEERIGGGKMRVAAVGFRMPAENGKERTETGSR